MQICEIFVAFCQARIQAELSNGDFLKVILTPIPSRSCEVKDDLGRVGK